MDIPDHYLRRPPVVEHAADEAFERLYAEQVSPGTGATIRYELTAPKWQFLCWMAEVKGVLLHGANHSTMDALEPRRSDDVGEFGARHAVYAASDGIWPMYFAIADRRVVTSLVNACVHVDDAATKPSYYYFSINGDAFAKDPWVAGTVYVLPRDPFEPEPEETWLGLPCTPTQWASAVPVRPLARLTVTPDDFPFLRQVRSHDATIASQRAARRPDNFPWLEP